MSCGHTHDRPLQAAACSAAQQFNSRTQNAVAVVFCEDNADPAVSLIANASNAAHMALAICQVYTQEPRPTDCVQCRDAYDRMVMAAGLLRELSFGRC